jgi:hypothetical protein
MDLNKFVEAVLIIRIPAPNGADKFEWEKIKIYPDGYNYYGANKLSTPLSPVSYIPKAKDRLYFYPQCNVPRYKVREWGKKNDASITVKEELATAKFASATSVANCIDTIRCGAAYKNDFINWLSLNNYDVNKESYIALKDALDNCSNDSVFLQSYGSNISSYRSTSAYGSPKSLKFGLDEKNVYHKKAWFTHIIRAKEEAILNSLLSSPNIFDQEDIISLINQDAIVIGKDMYSRLCDMLGNNNRADHLVALEIIANCNINPSLHYVLLLMKQYANTIINLKESKHVNFKSLLEYIGITRREMTWLNEDKIIDILMQKDVLTMSNISELAQAVKEIMMKAANTKHFLISKITVSKEIQEYIKNKEVQQQLIKHNND